MSNLPTTIIVDQNHKPIGRALGFRNYMEAWVDDNGTAWLPPTAWAYYALHRHNRRLQDRIEELEAQVLRLKGEA
ncbi:MAG TPA: hypothetical protein VD794_12965 [Flavisolibacter sp.]|nr:hypothetical protein [Flavisolibacter sp.]